MWKRKKKTSRLIVLGQAIGGCYTFCNSLLFFQAVVLKQDTAVGIHIRPGVLDLHIQSAENYLKLEKGNTQYD